MRKLLQINIVSNMLSTGKVCEDIAKVIVRCGWESYIAYGRNARKGISHDFRVGSMLYTYEHYIEHRLLDREGLASHLSTRQLIKHIEKIQPDIINLHNIHDHYLNYPVLFRYFATIDTPIVWTQHDCWAFTGGCMYFDMYECNQWKSGCKHCPEKRALFCNLSEKQFALKQRLLDDIKNLTYVSVSDWLNNLLKQSIQGRRNVLTIHNGVDLTMFKPIHQIESVEKHKFRILGVAAVWDARKGLDDFVKLNLQLPKNFEIILVGLTTKQISALPKDIKCIQRTQNLEELVQLYSEADVFVNPTYSDNFPTTNIEALACGTPVITYRTGGSPEAVDEKTGIVVEQGNIEALADAIIRMKNNPLSSADCRKRAEEYFDKDKCFEKYVNLYSELL